MLTNALRIYIASPYSSESEEQVRQNVVRSIDAGLELFKKGHYPYIPHLTYLVDKRAMETNVPMTWDDYLKWDLEWLRICDAILFLGVSRGTNVELEYARKLEKIEFYRVEDVPAIMP